MTGPSTSRAIACTDSKSPGEVIGKPASMMSTPSRASWWAISSFSCGSARCPATARRRAASCRRSGRAPARCAPGVGDVSTVTHVVPRFLSRSRLPASLRWYAATRPPRAIPPEGGAGEAEGTRAGTTSTAQISTTRREATTGSPNCRQDHRDGHLRGEDDLADVAPFGDHVVRGAGFLEGERAGDDGLDGAVVDQLLQRRRSRARASPRSWERRVACSARSRPWRRTSA